MKSNTIISSKVDSNSRWCLNIPQNKRPHDSISHLLRVPDTSLRNDKETKAVYMNSRERYQANRMAQFLRQKEAKQLENHNMINNPLFNTKLSTKPALEF